LPIGVASGRQDAARYVRQRGLTPHRFGIRVEREAAVHGWIGAEDELAAVCPPVGFNIRQGRAVLVEQLNPFLCRLAEFPIDLGFIVAMHAAAKKTRAAANEALVFVAPLHKFCEAGRLCFDFFARHQLSLFGRVHHSPQVPLLVVPGVVTGAATDCHPQSLLLRANSRIPSRRRRSNASKSRMVLVPIACRDALNR
jgi:hypothetical protein